MKTVSIFLAFLLLSILSCEDKKTSDQSIEEQIEDTTVVAIQKKRKGISYKKVEVTGIAKRDISQWIAFNNLEKEINNILEADYRILKTELEVLDEAFEALDESEFPEKLDVPRFRSKLIVLKTFTGKLANEVETNEDDEVLEKTITQISEELNAMKNQINELYESNIDTDILIIEPVDESEEQ